MRWKVGLGLGGLVVSHIFYQSHLWYNQIHCEYYCNSLHRVKKDGEEYRLFRKRVPVYVCVFLQSKDKYFIQGYEIELEKKLPRHGLIKVLEEAGGEGLVRLDMDENGNLKTNVIKQTINGIEYPCLYQTKTDFAEYKRQTAVSNNLYFRYRYSWLAFLLFVPYFDYNFRKKNVHKSLSVFTNQPLDERYQK